MKWKTGTGPLFQRSAMLKIRYSV